MWDMCQMLNIWHISHTKHKKQLLSDVAYVPKLYHLCSYRCKFATVWTDVVNQNNVFYLAFSLLSLLVLIFSLSLLTSDLGLPTIEKEQNDNSIGFEEKQIIFMGEATLIGSSPSSSPSEAQAAWARPLWSSSLRLDHHQRHRHWRHKQHGRGHSDHYRRHRRSDLADLSLSFLVVGCFDCWWLADFGWWWIGLWVWDLGWVWDFGWWCFFFFLCRGWYWL